ncbi:L-proline glycine betaine binding ABC transporter protein ProX [Desulfosporosinus sp. I2]|uniref:glycine betaine ABC transporter substrate-binding protein n=1 Tax=Desulfosporosinus sp. I2 TaxID=1617025 RepID=UPI00061F1C27|nr:glycine betaine ABC transporter substrate-binding protein [Desulfosporosinus sp. I2]KJR48495.1 L-proline glycine betaine binding ABC transporter protein ProX [Desulfosporosinus sp. I2]
MKKNIVLISIIAILINISLIGCGQSQSGTPSSSGDTITVGSKNFTENIILAHMMADMIEAKTKITVNRKVNLGGSNVAWKALQNNDIQFYPDYTGTIVANYYQEKTGTSQETLNKAQQLTSKDNLKLLNPFGFNNTYTLAVTQETAQKYGLNTFSDLANVSKTLILGCEFEFKDRPDGYPGLQKAYNMNFKDVKGMDHGIMYRSLTGGDVNVVDAFSTDGQLKVFNLKTLKDDKLFFPPYDALPVIRQDTLNKYPQIGDALNQLAGKLDEQIMQGLNAQVDSQGLKAETVAHDYLVSQGLINK